MCVFISCVSFRPYVLKWFLSLFPLDVSDDPGPHVWLLTCRNKKNKQKLDTAGNQSSESNPTTLRVYSASRRTVSPLCYYPEALFSNQSPDSLIETKTPSYAVISYACMTYRTDIFFAHLWQLKSRLTRETDSQCFNTAGKSVLVLTALGYI